MTRVSGRRWAVRRSPTGATISDHALRRPRLGVAPRWVWSAGLLGVGLLAGCAAPAAAPATSSRAEAGRALAQYVSNTPPVSAQMPCGDETASQIAHALSLTSVPAPQGTWADHVYRCSYTLPVGPLVLSVTVTPSDTAARHDLEAMRTQFAATDPEPELGQQAYSNAAGTLLAVKDNMVLHIDATGVPDDLGTTHEGRSDFARGIAAGIFNCWAGA
jgi:hypothetical protein